MIAENVRKVFEDNLWFVSTCGDGPHVVPVGFKRVRANGRAAIAAANPLTAEAYQVKGTAELVTEGPVFDHYAKLAEDTYHGACPAKCVVMITPEKLIVASPNGENKMELPL